MVGGKEELAEVSADEQQPRTNHREGDQEPGFVSVHDRPHLVTRPG
jgi:hypothetical protein